MGIYAGMRDIYLGCHSARGPQGDNPAALLHLGVPKGGNHNDSAYETDHYAENHPDYRHEQRGQGQLWLSELFRD